MNYNGRNKDQRIPLYLLRTDADFASVYKIKMQEGRYFSDQFPKDKTNAYVVNEAAIREMGLDSPLGKEIELWGRTGNIIGIAKDFHFNTFHEKIAPLLFQIPSPEQEAMNFREVSFRIKPYAIHESIALIKRKWNKFFPDEQFKCYFFNDNLNASYHAEQRMGELFKYFSLLAIFIACLGLHGLTAFTIEQKTKDIGVHKVLGATIANIILLLSKNYMRWIFFANLFAWPLAYFASTKWLQNFAYHIEISWWIFALAGGLTLTIALLTVSWQAVRAATANPIKALRYE